MRRRPTWLKVALVLLLAGVVLSWFYRTPIQGYSGSGAAVGGVFSARVGEGQPVELPITGIARDVGLAPGWMEHVVYSFVTPATLATR